MKYLTLTSLFSLFILTACGLKTDINNQTAHHIAMPAFMVERVIPAGAFGLNAWERMHKRGSTATIYIEGDSPTSVNVANKKIDMSKILALMPASQTLWLCNWRRVIYQRMSPI